MPFMFHNGEPVTAEDVKFSFERYRGISAKALKDKVAAVAGDGGGLDRSQEVRREGRRGRLQKGADRGRAVPLRVLHSRRGAGGRGLRRVLAQDAEREAPGVQVRPGHHTSHTGSTARSARRCVALREAVLNDLQGYGPRVAESGLGLIADYPWSAPYEDLKLK